MPTLDRADPVPRTAAAIGLATLALLPAWDAVTSLPAAERGLAAWAWVVVGTSALAVGLLWRPRTGRLAWLLRLPLLVLMAALLLDAAVFAQAMIRSHLAIWAGRHHATVRLAVLTLLAVFALAAVVWVWRRGLRASLAQGQHLALGSCALLCALPLVFSINYWLMGGPTTAAALASAKSALAAARPVVVVLVFDELDQRELDRHIQQLPNFRELRRTALSSNRLYPPANHTSESLPGMLTGEDFDYTAYSRSEVHVQTRGSMDWQPLSTRPHLLTDAQARGERVELVGWHLPYCNLFKALQGCWDDAAWRAPGAQVPLHIWLAGHSHWLGWVHDAWLRRLEGDLSAYSRAFFGSPANYRLRRIGQIFEAQSQRLLQVLERGERELVFAHLACPHPPSLTAAQVDAQDVFEAYRHNLVACDRLLGQVRSVLARRAPDHALVLTSDHWFRALDWQSQGQPGVVPLQRQPVPFLVQLNSDDGHAFSTDLTANNRVLRQLLTGLRPPAGAAPAGYSAIRALIEAGADSPTHMRKY